MTGLENRLRQLHGTVGDVLTVVERGSQDTRLERVERQLDRLTTVIGALCERVGYRGSPNPIEMPTAMPELMAVDPVRSNTAASERRYPPLPMFIDPAANSESTNASAVPAPTFRAFPESPRKSQEDARATPRSASTLLLPSETATRREASELPTVNVAGPLHLAVAASTSVAAPRVPNTVDAAPDIEPQVNLHLAPLPTTDVALPPSRPSVLSAPAALTLNVTAPFSGASHDASVSEPDVTASCPEASDDPDTLMRSLETLEKLGPVSRSRSRSVSPLPGTSSGKRKPEGDGEDEAGKKKPRL